MGAINILRGVALLVTALVAVTDATPALKRFTPDAAFGSDTISREFYGRIRDLLEQQNVRLADEASSNGFDGESAREANHGGGGGGGGVVVQPSGRPKTTHHHDVDVPPKPRLLSKWPSEPLHVGAVTAVAVNADGNPVIFHRGDRVWDVDSFNDTQHFQQPDEPIREHTILTLDARSGRTMAAHGAGQFYMPHGLTIDGHGNVWLTDVALHQVLKFRCLDDIDAGDASLVIGRAFTPGSQPDLLCKPTAVAVASTGEFFVADGYCNNRILKFNAAGRLLRMIPQPPDEFLSLNVPHGLALLESLDLLCIADRENSQVVCPRAGLRSSRGEGQPAATVQEPDLGRVYAVRAHGDFVFAVNGPTAAHIPVRGFTIDPRSEQIVDHWGAFSNPHDVAFAPNGSAMYVAEISPNRLWKFELV